VVCCSVLQCVAVCYSVLQCVASILKRAVYFERKRERERERERQTDSCIDKETYI